MIQWAGGKVSPGVNHADPEPRTVLAVKRYTCGGLGASRRGVSSEPPPASLAARWSPASLGTVSSDNGESVRQASKLGIRTHKYLNKRNRVLQ